MDSEERMNHSTDDHFQPEKSHSCSLHYIFSNKSKLWALDIDSLDFARQLDMDDPLQEFRKRFHYPKKKYIMGNDANDSSDDDEECIYFCGHSLGLQLKSIENELQDVTKNWARRAVESHFHGKFPAASCDGLLKENMAYLVGAEANEVAVMNGLTVNIHVMLSSFYRPTTQRHKILMLDNGFHSDLYAVRSHVRLRGYEPDESIVFLKPKPGNHLLNPKDILSFIEERGEEFAIIFLEGVHFYTGQLFDMKRITKVAHKKCCIVGFDLAHAIGNVELHVHDWNIDFAMWCTYKYMNCGAGSLGAIFVHNRHTSGKNPVIPMMAGWWGISDKFSLSREFNAAEGADRFKISNSSPFLAIMIHANLEVFREAGIERLVEKQHLLTGYLDYLLKKTFVQTSESMLNNQLIKIITPSNPSRRGCQISLLSLVPISELENLLKEKGIVCDVRKPSAIRITPVPLYNTFTEVYNFVHALEDILFNVSNRDEKENI